MKPNCWFAHKGLAITSSGTLYPCGQSKYTLGKFTDYNSLVNINRESVSRDFENAIPKECFSCSNREKRSLSSRRLYHYNWFSQEVNFDIEFLDISIGNLCNLKCRMCNPSISTSWIKDKKLADNLDFKLEGFNNSQVHDNINNDLIKFVSNLKTLRYIIIKGGEPFMHPRLFEFLETIKNKKEVTLQIITNGTHFLSNEEKNILSKFNKLNIFFSVEASGKMYQYIRGGNFTLDQILENFNNYKKFDNINEIGWIYTANIYGIYCFDKLQEKIDHQLDLGQQVFEPMYLNPLIAPDSEKQCILSKTKFQHYKDYLSTNPFLLFGITSDERTQYLHQFKKYTLELDKIRNESLIEIEPKFNWIYDV